MKHYPWQVCPQSIYGLTHGSNVYDDFQLPGVAHIITQLWYERFSHLNEIETPEYTSTIIDNIRHDDHDNWTPNLVSDVIERMDHNADNNVDGDFVELCRSILGGYDTNVANNDGVTEWNSNHDWNILQNDYHGLAAQFSNEFFKQYQDS